MKTETLESTLWIFHENNVSCVMTENGVIELDKLIEAETIEALHTRF